MENSGLINFVRKTIKESVDYKDAVIWRDFYHDKWIQTSNSLKKIIQSINHSQENQLREDIKEILLQHWKEICPLSKSNKWDDVYGKNSIW